MAPPRILLLTHEHELTKATNTGRVVLEALADAAMRIVWRRATPEPELLRTIEAGGVALVWPLSARTAVAPVREPHTYVVIDGTWQQARKIYNRSPYLQGLPTVALQPTEPSIYTLRRNQIGGGLCTAEAVACLLQQPGLAQHDGLQLARAISMRLHEFLTPASGRTGDTLAPRPRRAPDPTARDR